MIKGIRRELELRRGYLAGIPIDTIYFGGGTPSLLNESEMESIMDTIVRLFTLTDDLEITLEANPDDLSAPKLQSLKRMGVNRLSIGVQSFQNSTLKYLNRVHDRKQGLSSINQARDKGFENISIDLIYGIPDQPPGRWSRDLEEAMELMPEHLSCYCLTIEKRTVFGVLRKRGQLQEISDQQSAQEYQAMAQLLAEHEYLQYEISNFCQPGKISRHNSNYWKQIPYLGVGPGAHSFDLNSRQFNITSNGKYITEIATGKVPATTEKLTQTDRVNEIILTGLRTMWGVDLQLLLSQFGCDLVRENLRLVERYVEGGLIQLQDKRLCLTEKGKLLADTISADFFLDEEGDQMKQTERA